MVLELSYSQDQLDIFFPEETPRFTIVTKGRRFGLTQGGAHAFIEMGMEGWPLMWGDTINSNIDRYVERYFIPALQKSKIKYGWNSQKKQLSFDRTGGYVDFRSADRPENWEGFGYKRIFLNEAGIILKNEYLYTSSVLPMLMDYPDSALIAGGVPKGKITKDNKEHRFFALWKLAVSGQKGYKAFNFSSYDSPFLSEDDIHALEDEIMRMNPAMVRQEIYGEFVEGAAGLLWDEVLIEKFRIQTPPELRRIVVAIDPAVTSTEGSDETGIIVVGLDIRGNSYVLDDASGKYSPLGWANMANEMVFKWDADAVVGEINQGGDMVKATVRQVNPDIRFIEVRATKGKRLRAEPVYSLYEEGKVSHVGIFPALESQMCNFNPDNHSPDRVDALVHGITELMGKGANRLLAHS